MTTMQEIAARHGGVRRRRRLEWVATVAVLAVAGCATAPPSTVDLPKTSPVAPPAEVPPAPAPAEPVAPPTPRNVEPPPPKLNLSGFPLPYRQGYADGCATATGGERKDAARFSADMNYRTGWTDGRALCKRKLAHTRRLTPTR